MESVAVKQMGELSAMQYKNIYIFILKLEK